jgi:uncharacterized protein YeaO (DUF488 family)
MPEPGTISVRRVFDRRPGRRGEVRVLVDRVWPRGVRKESLKLDRWARDLAPSDGLRRWFGHDPKKWEEFQRRYRFELAEKAASLVGLAEAARDAPVVLLYGARDELHNQAVVLKEVLEEGIAH